MHKREINIDGTVIVPRGISMDEFVNEFLEFLESKGYYFGGGFVDLGEVADVAIEENTSKEEE